MAVTCTTAASRNNHWLHCLPERAVFYGIVRAVGDIEANLTDLGTDRDATGGDHCIRQQCSMRNMLQDGIREKCDTFRSKSCGHRKRIARSSFGVGGHVAKLGRHWNESTNVRVPDVAAEADAASPERGSNKTGVGMPHCERRAPCEPRRGWRRS